jgi:hypothetical protein
VEHQDRVGPGRYRIHPHLLRHSFAMWSLDNGVPIYDLQGSSLFPVGNFRISISGLKDSKPARSLNKVANDSDM